MANDLVVQLGAKLDQFAADMNQAGDMADSAVTRIENSFSSLNPGLGGFASLGTVITAAVASVGVLVTALQQVNGELADIKKNADFVGVSVERFQSIQFAATQGGVGSKEAVDDLRNMASLLADAKVNENSLTRLLAANNVAYKDRNGEVIKLNQALAIAGDLLGKFSSMPEKTKAAQMLGLSENWVNALKGGSKAFESVAESAETAGAVIDKATVAKAAEFDAAWKKSTALLASQFKATAGDIAGWLDDLITKAGDLLDSINKANNTKGGSGQTKFNERLDSIVIAARIDDGTASVKDLERAIEIIEAHHQIVPQELLDQLAQLRDEAAGARKEVDALNRATQAENFPGGVPLPGARPAGADRPDPNAAKLPLRKTGEGRDQFEIGIDQITKRTATINADTAATLQNSAVQAQYRAEFTLLNDILRDNGEVTQAQIDKYEKLRPTMSAVNALTESGITLTGKHAEAFIKASEGIKQASDASIVMQQKLHDLNQISSTVGSALSTAFSDAIVEGKSLNDVFTSLLKTLEKAAINSIFASIFSPGVGGGLSPFAKLISGNAEGTDNWQGGPTWVGEKGPEIINLPKGSQVIPNAVARNVGGGSVNISPTYQIDATGADAAALARLQRALVTLHASIESRAVKAIQSQQFRSS